MRVIPAQQVYLDLRYAITVITNPKSNNKNNKNNDNNKNNAYKEMLTELDNLREHLEYNFIPSSLFKH